MHQWQFKTGSSHSRENKVPTLADYNLSHLNWCTYHSKHWNRENEIDATPNTKKNRDITESIERRIHCNKKRSHAKKRIETRTASKSSGSEQDEIPIYFEANHYIWRRSSFKLGISLRSMLTEWSARELFTRTSAEDALETLFLIQNHPLRHISFLQRSRHFITYPVVL